jgi:hypothetical protein
MSWLRLHRPSPASGSPAQLAQHQAAVRDVRLSCMKASIIICLAFGDLEQSTFLAGHQAGCATKVQLLASRWLAGGVCAFKGSQHAPPVPGGLFSAHLVCSSLLVRAKTHTWGKRAYPPFMNTSQAPKLHAPSLCLAHCSMPESREAARTDFWIALTCPCYTLIILRGSPSVVHPRPALRLLLTAVWLVHTQCSSFSRQRDL